MQPAVTDSIDILFAALPFVLSGAAGMFIGLGVGYWAARKDVAKEQEEQND